MRHVVLLTALGAALFVLAITSTGKAYDGEACRVALHVLQQKKRETVRQIAVLPHSVAEPLSQAESKETARYVRGMGPIDLDGETKLELLLKSADLEDFSPVKECADLRQWMDASHIIYDEAQIERAKRVNGRYPFVIIGLSMPAVSTERGKALMTVSTSEEGLSLSWIKRTKDGRWAIEEEVETAIS